VSLPYWVSNFAQITGHCLRPGVGSDILALSNLQGTCVTECSTTGSGHVTRLKTSRLGRVTGQNFTPHSHSVIQPFVLQNSYQPDSHNGRGTPETLADKAGNKLTQPTTTQLDSLAFVKMLQLQHTFSLPGRYVNRTAKIPQINVWTPPGMGRESFNLHPLWKTQKLASMLCLIQTSYHAEVS